ncbi:MAG: hypothetical protein QXK88_05130 [Desulfurococcaceae archaeon]
MSYTKSSALRWFESILENARRRARVTTGRITLGKVLESMVRLGDVVFPKLMHTAERAAYVIGKLQVTMIESMITASILYGILLLTLVMLVVAMR